jgi:transcriptional regulator with XRE-family HTH domain
MPKTWKEVRRTLAPERERRIKEKVSAEVQKLSLHQLREARNLTQTSLADLLHVPQGSISRLERRTDMYLSTLRDYIRAMGGDLKITAVFPNGSIEISQFQDVEYRR